MLVSNTFLKKNTDGNHHKPIYKHLKQKKQLSKHFEKSRSNIQVCLPFRGTQGTPKTDN